MRLHASKVAFVALVASVLVAPAAAQAADNFTCRASAARVTSPLLNSEPTVANPANNPCTSQTANLATLTVGARASATALNAKTTSTSGGAESAASVATAAVNLGGISITATVLESRATASCSHGSPAFAGSSRVASLSVNGISLTVTGKPNQTILLPGGTVIVINEQIKESDRITVRALRVGSGLLSTEVVLAESIADVSGHPCRTTDPHHH